MTLRDQLLEMADPAYRDFNARIIPNAGEMLGIRIPQLRELARQIARSDQHVCEAEIEALREVAQAMRLSAQEVDSMLNLRGDSLEDAYKVLEVSPTATDEEVRKAYRRLALMHHPDKVAALGDDVRKAAEEKFQSINNAKERVYKARGMR